MTTRITGATRLALEAAARESGRSLSQEVERRLDDSLSKPTLSGSGRRNQAMGASIAMLAERLEGWTGHTWREDSFTAQALIAAARALMMNFMPPLNDEPTIPERLAVRASQLHLDEQSTYHRPAPFGTMLAFHLVTEMEEAGKEGSEYPIGIRWPEAKGVIWKISRDLNATEAVSP